MARISPLPLFLAALAACAPDAAIAIHADPAEPDAPVAPVAPVEAAPAGPSSPTEFVEEKPAKAPAVLPSVGVRAPTKEQVIPTDKSADFALKFDIKSWRLSATGNAVHVLLDGRRVRRITDPKQTLKLGDFTGGKPLDEGHHLLAFLPVHPSGEAVKPVGKRSPATIVSFYVGKKSDPTWKEGSPLLLLNTPTSGAIPSDGPLLDFFVVNAEIARGKYVVHAAVMGPDLAKGESINQWKPWRIKNARPGEHTVKLELFQYVADSLESSSAATVTMVTKPVGGKWASVTREIVLDK